MLAKSEGSSFEVAWFLFQKAQGHGHQEKLMIVISGQRLKTYFDCTAWSMLYMKTGDFSYPSIFAILNHIIFSSVGQLDFLGGVKII